MNLVLRAAYGLVATALLTACGKPLGTYEVQNVTLVSASRLGQIDPNESYAGHERQLIRIEFTSTVDLETASEGGDLYVHGDFCPVKDAYQLGIIGPFYDDQPRLLSRKVTSYEKSPDGRVRMSVESKNRHPSRDEKTGRYVYTAYLIPSAPKDQFSDAYDLRHRNGDLCLRIDHPGYYVIPSRSNTFKIDAGEIQKVLGSPRSRS